MLYETVNSLSEHALEIALTWASAGICCHHTRYRGIGAEKGTKFGGRFKLGGQYGLEHGEEEMFLTTFVLVTV